MVLVSMRFQCQLQYPLNPWSISNSCICLNHTEDIHSSSVQYCTVCNHLGVPWIDALYSSIPLYSTLARFSSSRNKHWKWFHQVCVLPVLEITNNTHLKHYNHIHKAKKCSTDTKCWQIILRITLRNLKNVPATIWEDFPLNLSLDSLLEPSALWDKKN